MHPAAAHARCSPSTVGGRAARLEARGSTPRPSVRHGSTCQPHRCQRSTEALMAPRPEAVVPQQNASGTRMSNGSNTHTAVLMTDPTNADLCPQGAPSCLARSPHGGRPGGRRAHDTLERVSDTPQDAVHGAPRARRPAPPLILNPTKSGRPARRGACVARLSSFFRPAARAARLFGAPRCGAAHQLLGTRGVVLALPRGLLATHQGGAASDPTAHPARGSLRTEAPAPALHEPVHEEAGVRGCVELAAQAPGVRDCRGEGRVARLRVARQLAQH